MGASESKSLPKALESANIDKAEANEYKKIFEMGDMAELRRKIDQDINRWSKVPVNIAVIGNSGVGKSSFINSFRGLKATSKGAAAVGVVETTNEPVEYVHPENKNLALWDLPGVGTPRFKKENYLQAVQFDKYDFFLILTATRFTENDLWLGKKVHNVGKKFFLIRTKIGIDVMNAKHDNPKGFKEDTIKSVRNAMVGNLKNGELPNVPVYLIDNRFPLYYDFPNLVKKMIDSAQGPKQEAMIFTMTNLTAELIEKKKAALNKRILKVALVSAAGGAVPLPGTGLLVDMALIKNEISFYRKQLGLDDESLNEIAKSLNISIDELLNRLDVSILMFGKSSVETLVKELAKYSGKRILVKEAQSIAGVVVPIIGNVIAGVTSYGSTVATLRSILNSFVSEATMINELLEKRFSITSHL